MQALCRSANMRLAFEFLASVLLAGIFGAPCALVAADEAPVERPRQSEPAARNTELGKRRAGLTAVAPSVAIPSMAQANPPPVALSDPLLLSPNGGSSPDIAVDRFGRAHVVWRGLDSLLYYAQVDASNTITIQPKTLYDFAIRASAPPRIAVDAAGDAHIISATLSSPFPLLYVKVHNGTRVLLKTFTMQIPFTAAFDFETDSGPSIDINPQTGLPVVAAEARVAWHYTNPTVYRYNEEISVISLDAAGNPDRTSRWTAYSLRSSTDLTYRSQYCDVAVDSLGTTHCVWVYADPNVSGLNIRYAKSGSNTWSEIATNRNVANLIGGPEITRGLPGIVDIVWATTGNSVIWQETDHNGLTVVDDSGVSGPMSVASNPNVAAFDDEVFFGWADSREGTTARDIYSRSLLGAVPEINVSESSGSAFNHALSARGPNSVSFVWQDTRSGANQIFYRTAEKPAILTLHRLTQAALNFAQGDGIDTPLEVKPSPNDLANQPQVLGLVADGVTPLLIKLAPLSPAAATYQISFSVQGGTLDLASHLRVLTSGQFVVGDQLALSLADPIGYAHISGIQPEEITFSGVSELDVTVTATTGGVNTGSTTFKIRKPPVVLVHGYNADYLSWSPSFRAELSSTRPSFFHKNHRVRRHAAVPRSNG